MKVDVTREERENVLVRDLNYDELNFCKYILLEEEQAKKDPRYRLRLINNEAKSALEELEREYKPSPYLVRSQRTFDHKIILKNVML